MERYLPGAILATAQSNDGFACRSRLTPARRFLLSMRRSRAAAGGLVARRRSGGCAARRIRSKSRASASSRLRACARWRCAVMTMTPSRVRRDPARRSSRPRTSCGSEGDRRASKRSCTALATLFTFCPPGPDARTKDSVISRSSSAIFVVTGIMSILSAANPKFVPARRNRLRISELGH